MSFHSLPPSTNKAHDRLIPREQLIDTLDECIESCIPELEDASEGGYSLYSRLEGAAREKYGDYSCESILIISEGLRRQDPDLFDETLAQRLLQVLLSEISENLEKYAEKTKQMPKFFQGYRGTSGKMITNLILEDDFFLTFKLSPIWMTERIKKMLNEGGMDTWAPRTYQESIVVDGPAPDIDAYRHADEIRFRYLKEMLICMLDYSGVVVGTSFINDESHDAVQKYFAENRGVITSIRHKTNLFAFKGGHKAHKFCEDLQTLWSALYKLRGREVVYLTPQRRQEYVKKCFDAATDEEWLSFEWNPLVSCCGYRTSNVEREKLTYLWKMYESDSKGASLAQLGSVAGYTREASFECAIKYAYLKTHRLAECMLNIDEMLDEEGNTFACLLKTQVFLSSLSESSGGGGMVKEYKEAFLSKEHELALHLVQFTEVIEKACLEFLLHPVCEYTWILCKKFMSYYLEVMEFLDLNTYKSKFYLCDATKVVLAKCFHLLRITPESSRESSRVPKVKTGFKISPYSPSLDPRPNKVNPRFEMFCMNIAVTNSSFKKGALHGIVSLVDADGLLFDGRLPLNMNEQGHVAYFYREWYDAIGICNNSFVHFGSPSPCHIVSFSAALEISVRLFVTTADKCFQMCNCERTIKLSEFWDEQQLDHKVGTLPFKVDDGSILIDFIALRDAVDVTMQLTFESSDPLITRACVSGCIFAYYEGMLDDLDSISKHSYKALIYKAAESPMAANLLQISVPAEFDTELHVGPLPLRKSVMAVPVGASLVFEACFYDEFGKHLVTRTRKFPAQTKNSSEWRIFLKKDCFLKLTLEWSQGPKSAYC